MPVINTQETEVKRLPFFSPVVFQLYDIMLRYATFHHLSLRPVSVFFGFKCALNLVQDPKSCQSVVMDGSCSVKAFHNIVCLISVSENH